MLVGPRCSGCWQQTPAEAYFCGDDLLAVGALSAIEEAGLSVPGDIGLIGLNDMEMSRWQNIGLTTIRQPVAQIIEAAIDLVVATIETPDRPPEIRLFPCQVIERRTLRRQRNIGGRASIQAPPALAEATAVCTAAIDRSPLGAVGRPSRASPRMASARSQ